MLKVDKDTKENYTVEDYAIDFETEWRCSLHDIKNYYGKFNIDTNKLSIDDLSINDLMNLLNM